MNEVLSPIQLEIIEMIESNPSLQPTTKAQYAKAITNYLATGASLADAVALSAYAAHLPQSSRAFLKAAIRLWGDSIALKAKAGATPENIGAVQATVYRIEALTSAIQVQSSQGEKAHIWLSQAEVRGLLGSCNPKTLQGQRDRIILGLLVGAGLRREELAALTFDDVVMQPVEGKPRTVLNVHGKGAKDRIVPINDRLAAALTDWGKALNQTGPIARALSRGGAIQGSLSGIGIFKIVGKAGAMIGKPELAPHDLRRTYAQLGYEAGIPITQISKLLGHATVSTTQKYLNLDLDLVTTISDFIPF
jgi:integrase